MADSNNPGFRSDDARQGDAGASSSAGGAQRSSGRPGSRRGFAAMDPSRQREIASKGGRAAHAKGTAHEWSADEAREAGRKGGVAVSKDRAHMAAIGREGGGARGAARRRRLEQGANGRGDREQAINVSREMGSADTAGAADDADEAENGGAATARGENASAGGTASGEERQGSAGTHRDTGRSGERL